MEYDSDSRCPGRVIVVEDVYVPTGVHNHPSREAYIYNLKFENECKARAETEGGSLRQIYNSILDRYLEIFD